MVKHFCDLNVFLAGAVEVHGGHEKAKAFFCRLSQADTVEFCRATQLGFLRLLTQNIAEVYEPFSNCKAREALGEWLSLPYARISPEPAGIESLWLGLTDREARRRRSGWTLGWRPSRSGRACGSSPSTENSNATGPRGSTCCFWSKRPAGRRDEPASRVGARERKDYQRN